MPITLSKSSTKNDGLFLLLLIVDWRYWQTTTTTTILSFGELGWNIRLKIQYPFEFRFDPNMHLTMEIDKFYDKIFRENFPTDKKLTLFLCFLAVFFSLIFLDEKSIKCCRLLFKFKNRSRKHRKKTQKNVVNLKL